MNNDDNDEDTCYILKEYLNYHNKYIEIYGENSCSYDGWSILWKCMVSLMTF